MDTCSLKLYKSSTQGEVAPPYECSLLLLLLSNILASIVKARRVRSRLDLSPSQTVCILAGADGSILSNFFSTDATMPTGTVLHCRGESNHGGFLKVSEHLFPSNGPALLLYQHWKASKNWALRLQYPQ